VADPAPRYERYVAIGDSTAEGLDDPDGRGGYRGWANRLAERLAALQGGVLYANLALRGRRARQIRDEQLAPALAHRPDLVTLACGTNDVLRPRFDAAEFQADVCAIQRAFVERGAVVLSFTLPDLTPVMPVARPLAGRIRAMNQALKQASRQSGARLVDIADHAKSSDPRLWSEDRLHANSRGHALVAHALAHALGLPDADASWRDPLPPAAPLGPRARVAAELRWCQRHLMPWLWRHARGRSSGDGRRPKRPELAWLEADPGA
jgi:lysophospholipase L1-like esterase